MHGKEAPLNGNRVLNGKLYNVVGLQSSALRDLRGRYSPFNQRWEIIDNHSRLDREQVHV